MKNDLKRFGSSTIAIVLSAVMILSSMVLNTGTVTTDTANALTVAEKTDTTVSTDIVSLEENAETTATDENSVTVDIQPEDIQSSVLSMETVQGTETDKTPAEYTVESVESKKAVKKLPESSGTTSKFYFANIFKDDDGKWTTPCAHYWKGNSTGEKELSSENGLYYIQLDTNTYENVIFYTSDWTGKSKDLTLSGNENKIYVPATNYKTNSGDVGFDGWWLTSDEYNASVSKTKTIFFNDNVGWNQEKMYAYVWASGITATEIEMTKNEDGYYTATIDSKYQKVIFKKTSGTWNANDVTIGYSLVGHDELMLFNSCSGTQYFNSTGKRYGTWVNANSNPDESKLISTTKSTVSGWRMYLANNDSSFSAGSNNYYISCENDNSKCVPVYQIEDTNGSTWYYSEVTASQAASQMWFVLSVYGTDSTAGAHWWYKKGDSGISVTTSNSIVAPVQKKDRDNHYMGLVETKKSVESIKVYFNSLDDSFFKYTVVPITKTAPDGSINVIAKDGTIRDNFKKFASLADTKIMKIGSDSRDGSSIGSVTVNDDCLYGSEVLGESAFIPLGSTIQIQTTINEGKDNNGEGETLRKKYYVKAFNINGETVFPEEKGWNSDGVYTCNYTLPASTTASQIEITPVYFYNENTTENTTRKYITFIAENYIGDVVTQWGKKSDGTDGTAILAGYAWYGQDQDELDADAKDKPSLGGYPGQPMVYENGHYTMTVPTTNDAGDHIQGVTLNNYVWDLIHCDMQGASGDTDREKINAQTYDYDDFVVLSHADPLPEFIVFRFKYETTKNANLGDSVVAKNSDYGNKPTSSNYNNAASLVAAYDDAHNGNGWEEYDDYYGNTIDLFNNILKRKGATEGTIAYENNKNEPFYVVSQGYKEIYYGHFTTLWYVYDYNGKFVGNIPSSALYYEGDMSETKGLNDPPKWFMEYATRSNTNTGELSTQINDFWNTYYKLYSGKDISGSALNHPVQITYESAIRGQDQNSDGHPKDPGLRNDGNWYYSKSGESFNAEIVIKYSTTDNLTNFSKTDTFVTKDSDKPYAGDVTGAHAYFTTESYTPNGLTTAIKANFYQDYIAENVRASKDNFTVAANQTSLGTDGKTMYEFKGWFIEYDGVESPLVTEIEDDKVVASAADMIGYTKLIAKYAPVVNSNTNDSVLTITHDLYKNAVKFGESYEVLNGEGTPKISVQVIDTNNNNAVVSEVPVYELDDRTVKIYQSSLSKYTASNYKLQVVLSVESDSTTEFNTTYLKTESESTSAGAEGVIGYTEYTRNNTHGPNSAGTWTATKTASKTSGSAGTDTVTYTTSVADLFNNGTLQANTIKFYTQLTSTTVNVVFKYYDRDMGSTSTSQATDIAKTPSTFSITETLGSGATNVAKLGSAVTNAVNDLDLANTDVSKRKINNVIDDYKFWATQSSAKTELAKLDIPGKSPSTKYNSEYTEYHTDYYSRQSNNPDYMKEAKENLTEDQIKALTEEKWVTYKDADGKEVPIADGSTEAAELNKVATVEVWGYNYPKQYKMTFLAYKLGDEYKIQLSNGEYKSTGLYFATAPSDSTVDTKDYNALPYYYNERVGAIDSNTNVNGVSDHLTAYGISQSSSATVVEAKKFTNYEFDGWYEYISDSDSYVKISSDKIYGNRVTRDATLVAGYKKADNSEITDKKGMAVVNNQIEKYVDSNGTQRVRYVTQLNTYGFGDSDDNFKSVSIVYIKLPADMDAYEAELTVSTLFADADFKKGIIAELDKERTSTRSVTTALVVDVDSTETVNDRGSVVYTYDIRPTYTDGTPNSDPTGNQIVFTNKNRGQFVLDIKEDAVSAGKASSNLLVLSAVKYKDDNVTTEKLKVAYKVENETDPDDDQLKAYLNTYLTKTYGTVISADTTNGYVYLASDNYVVYDNNTHTTAQQQ